MNRKQIIFLVVCGLGLGAMLWSAYDFFALMSGERIGASFCAINSYWNCDRASLSPLGSWKGIPFAALSGASWFIVVASLGFGGAATRNWLRPLLILGILVCLTLGTYLVLHHTGCVICYFGYSCVALAAYFGWSPSGIELSRRGILLGMGIGLSFLLVFSIVKGRTFDRRFSEEEFQQWFALTEEVPLASKFQKGNLEGKIVVVEFSDFGCPFCSFAAESILPFLAHQPDVRVVYYPFPLDNTCNSLLQRQIHPHACDWAKAAVCAHEQGRLWEYHDKAFKVARDRGELPVLTEVLDEFDLDSNALKTCLTKPETTQELQRLIEVARQLKITTTPSFFIAGRRFEGFVPMPLLRRALEELRK